LQQRYHHQPVNHPQPTLSAVFSTWPIAQFHFEVVLADKLLEADATITRLTTNHYAGTRGRGMMWEEAPELSLFNPQAPKAAVSR
jgi:hypothetical protein